MMGNGNKTALNDREKDIAHLLCQGFSNDEIATKLNISYSMVRWNLTNMYEKYRLDRTQGSKCRLKFVWAFIKDLENNNKLTSAS